MKQLLLPCITKFLLILVFIIAISDVVNVVEAANNRGVKAVILYTYDDSSATGSSVVTMEVDKNTFMNVIQDSQTNARDAKPLKFIQNNGFFDLLEGDSSQFSFMSTSGMADCDCKCTRRPVITTRTTTTRKPDCPNGRGSLPYCCENGARNKDCCANNGSGPYCCTNGANNPDCCVNGGSGPYCCTNGANNQDCCVNGGIGKYCCTNGANTPNCELPTVRTTTRRSDPVITTTTRPFVTQRTSTAAPTYLPPTTTTTLNPCPTGGFGPYCCKNGANNIDCCANGGTGPYCCLNKANNPDCCANGGSGPYCCTNGANNPDCCANGGRGQYCCVNGADNPDCSISKLVSSTTPRPVVVTTPSRPVIVTTPSRPVVITTTQKTLRCSNGAPENTYPHCCANGANNKDCCTNGGRGRFCCTNGADNPTCEKPTPFTKKKDVFRGPTYLPVARVTTERPSTTTHTYTYGSRPTFTYRFSFTNGAWTYVPRSTSYTTRETTTTAKYAYDQPINGISYNGADNAL